MRKAASNDAALPRIDIPLASAQSWASNKKYPSTPMCSAPASIIVWRERVAIWILQPSPNDSLARISSMAQAPVMRDRPRISVNHLAMFMVSSETTKLRIIREAKNPNPPPVIRYRDVRPIVCRYLADARRQVNPLVDAEQLFEQRSNDPSVSPLSQDDAKKSIEVLHALQRMSNKMPVCSFALAPKEQSKLVLGGVLISIVADLLVEGSVRNRRQTGCAILRLTQNDGEKESARSRRKEMGLYVATLARLHADQNLALSAPVHNRYCMAIDVQHGECFPAPTSNVRRIGLPMR